MLQRLAYRYHRFWGIMFITIIRSGLIKIDFSKIYFSKSKALYMLFSEGEVSSLKSANAWITSTSITASKLKGKVVLIHFCTYSCINWLCILPYVRAWGDKYKDNGLVVIGVHTPEFSFEKNIDNIRRTLKDTNIEYPIAIDNDSAIGNAFKNNYWPALYFVDTKRYSASEIW